MSTFDINRMILLADELTPKPLAARDLIPLSQAIEAGTLPPETDVLTFTFEQTSLVMSIFEMMYHHVAQGEINGQAWVVSMCMLCNSGNAFSPMVEGQVLHFSPRAVYDGMILLVDDETQSYWHHITGECLHGTYLGKRLTLLSDARQMNAAQALAQYPEAILIKASLSPKREAIAAEHAAFRKDPTSQPVYLEGGNMTMGQVDPRLPRLDIGLGVWTPTTQRYYSFNTLSEQDNVIFDTVDGQPLVVYVDPETSVPCAIYVNAANGKWEGDTLRLQGGLHLHQGVVYDDHHNRVAVSHPLQLFMRWFGFAFTFPDCEVFGHMTIVAV